MKLLEYLDFSAVEPGLYIKNKKKFYTVTGAVLNSLAFLAILGISISFIINYLEKNQPIVISGEIAEYTRLANFSEIPFILHAERTGGLVYDTSLGYFVVQKLSFSLNSPPKSEILKVKTCNSPKHLANYSHLFEMVNLTEYFCFESGNTNAVVSGKRGDKKEGFSSITLFYTKCSNNSEYNPNPGKCADEETIESQFKIIPLLRIGTLDYVLDHSLTEDPYIPTTFFKTFTMSNSLFSYVNYLFFKQSFYSSDDGWVFEEMQKYYHVSIDSSSTEILHNVVHPFPGTIGILNIFNYDKANNYKRSYVKLQVLIANIGGVVKSILLVAMILNYTISDGLLKLYLINTVINNSNENDRDRELKFSNSLIETSNILFNNYHNQHKAEASNNQLVATPKKNHVSNPNNYSDSIYKKQELIEIIISSHNKNNKFSLSTFQILFNCCFNSKKNKMSEFIKKRDLALKVFSVENFAFMAKNVDYIKEILFNKEQIYLIDNLPNKTLIKHAEDLNYRSFSEN